MPPDDLHGILAFLRAAERLKTVTRSGWTSAGQPESVAEHTWRLCLLALVLGPRLPRVRMERLLRICIVHDLREAIGGDIPAPVQAARARGAARGRDQDAFPLSCLRLKQLTRSRGAAEKAFAVLLRGSAALREPGCAREQPRSPCRRARPRPVHAVVPS